MEWIKASVRPPNHYMLLPVKINGKYSIASKRYNPEDEDYFVDPTGDIWPYDQIEWLDESQSTEGVKSAEECLNSNKPYGRNWSEFLLPDQMEFFYRAMEEYKNQPLVNGIGKEEILKKAKEFYPIEFIGGGITKADRQLQQSAFIKGAQYAPQPITKEEAEKMFDKSADVFRVHVGKAMSKSKFTELLTNSFKK